MRVIFPPALIFNSYGGYKSKVPVSIKKFPPGMILELTPKLPPRLFLFTSRNVFAFKERSDLTMPLISNETTNGQCPPMPHRKKFSNIKKLIANTLIHIERSTHDTLNMDKSYQALIDPWSFSTAFDNLYYKPICLVCLF
jgi:hypothetical protein